jgi:3-oxoadipate enol-lactonase
MPTTTIENHELRYRVYGDATNAPPLVLLHGAAGGQYVWLEQRRLATAQVITLDLPGHGGSQPALASVEICRYAELVAAFTSALGHERFIPVGHSMGGAVALTLALDFPARIPALVLIATGARLPVSEFVFAAIDTSFDQFGELLAQTAYAPQTDRALVKRFTTGPLQTSRDQARADFETCVLFDVRGRLEEIAVPTLLIAGAQDQLVSTGRMMQLASGLADCQLRTIPDAGHMVMQEQPDAVNQAIQAFVERVTSSA